MRPRLTYANVMATIAVFIALGSGAYAAKQLPKNSVGTKQLKRNAVTKAKIKKNSVNGQKVRKNAINSAKVKNHSLRAADFERGQLPAGLPGPPGEQGPRGEDATNLFAYVSDVSESTPAVLEYGKGAIEVSDPEGDNDYFQPYVVTFDRDLTGCVGNATTGQGRPSGATDVVGATHVAIGGSSAKVFISVNNSPLDDAFMLSVFC